MATTTQVAFWQRSWVQEVARTVLAIVLIGALLIVVGWTTSQVGVLGERMHKLAGVFQDENNQVTLAVAPAWLVAFENTTPVIAYIVWACMAALVTYLVAFASSGVRAKLAESGQRLDVVLGLVAGGVLSGLTGYLWAVWNPVPILPPFIHLRIFSFLIGVWGILIGRATGFVTGYVGGIVWGFASGYFVITHTPVSDGFWVGLMTGWFISVMLRQGRSREELLRHIEANRWRYYLRSAWVGLIGGVVMAFFVAVSIKLTSPLSWWAGFWTIGVMSDTLPMVIWIGPISEAVLRATRRLTWLPNF